MSWITSPRLNPIVDYMYPLSPTYKTRTVPMRVLCVGPSRSGTDSLAQALKILGYSHVYHGFDTVADGTQNVHFNRLNQKKWFGDSNNGDVQFKAEDFDPVLGDCEAVTDAIASQYAAELIEAYPEAKVILNVRRDTATWHYSVMQAISPLTDNWSWWFRSLFEAELFWGLRAYFYGSWRLFYRGNFANNGRWVLKEHCAMVCGLLEMRGERERLLFWDVNEGWAPLCNFLGKKVPDQPFPKGNTQEEHQDTLNRLFKERLRRSNRNLLFVMGLTLLLVGAAVKRKVPR